MSVLVKIYNDKNYLGYSFIFLSIFSIFQSHIVGLKIDRSFLFHDRHFSQNGEMNQCG